jgi:mannose-6-phosphate isomerase-like protein (cupin superfamily)
MSKFIEVQRKGLSKCWLAATVDPEKLRLHITEILPGTRAHPPHTHSGIEGFYILEGSGVIEMDGETVPVESNQAVILDPDRMHGLVNTGNVPMKYLVIIGKP